MSYAFPLSIDWHCLCGDALASHVTRAEGEECHGHCQTTPLDCRGFGYRPIDHTGRTPAIAAIFEAAGRSPNRWPRSYTCDLSTDYKWLIGADAPQRFIWILREQGTYLFSLDQHPDPAWQAGYNKSSLEWIRDNHPEAEVYHWNGFSLAPISYETALVLAVIPPIPAGSPAHELTGGGGQTEAGAGRLRAPDALSETDRAALRERLGSTHEKFEVPG